MAKTFSLNNRVAGPWSNYESFLLKDENTHVGWIEWTSKNTFRLKKCWVGRGSGTQKKY